jgi:hypothetical protein
MSSENLPPLMFTSRGKAFEYFALLCKQGGSWEQFEINCKGGRIGDQAQDAATDQDPPNKKRKNRKSSHYFPLENPI